MSDKPVTITLSESDLSHLLSAIDKEATFCRDEAFGSDEALMLSLADRYTAMFTSIDAQRKAGRAVHTDEVLTEIDNGLGRVIVNTTTTVEYQVRTKDGWIVEDNTTVYGLLTDAEIRDRASVWTD